MAPVSDLVRDLWQAMRTLLRSPGHALVVVATLAIGVGAAAAVFAVVREALLRPLPFREPADSCASGTGDRTGWTPRCRRRCGGRCGRGPTSSRAVGGSVDSMYTITGQGEPESVVGYRFSTDFFPMLGRAPLLGRVFAPGEDRAGAERVVVLSHRLWRRKLGRRPRGRRAARSPCPATRTRSSA